MHRDRVILQLLSGEETPATNILKKLLLCTHHGWLHINNFPPDKNFSLADYIFDEERIILDDSQLSESTKKQFHQWFYLKNEKTARAAYFGHTVTNHYRGYTAEVGLSWWGRILNFLFYRRKTYHWKLSALALSRHYQLRNIEITPGKEGLCVGLLQHNIPEIEKKYEDPEQSSTRPIRNVKRIILTDELVNRLTSLNVSEQNYSAILKKPHPFAIDVVHTNRRFKAMHEYRLSQRFYEKPAWYIRLWQWLKSCFQKNSLEIEMELLPSKLQSWTTLAKNQNAVISQNHATQEILIKEKRPDIDSMVFCGGGAKIFGHVGAYRAFEEAGLKALKFAGSSAGGIMALLCYLGYSSKEIHAYFQNFRHEHLIHYDINLQGMSDNKGLKAGIDYMLIKKVNQIIEKYQIGKTIESQKFLLEEVFYQGKITFHSLRALKKRYPDCGLGDELIITATNIQQQKTDYFSTMQTPDVEVSHAVAMSANFPIVFKPTLHEGNRYNDGGILNNFPTEVFKDEQKTFLTAEQGNCLHLVAFQFDNGTEQDIMHKRLTQMYRENFLWNGLLRFITGVKDPASGWVRDRLKLLKYSNQSILLPIGKVAARNFELDKNTQLQLNQSGYEATKEYINVRYAINQHNQAVNEEYLYKKFNGLEEALYFSCYRQRSDWFKRLAKIAFKQGFEKDFLNKLYKKYFRTLKNAPLTPPDVPNKSPEISDFNSQLMARTRQKALADNMNLFVAVYPVLLKLSSNLLKNKKEAKLYRNIRHDLTPYNAIAWRLQFKVFKANCHIFFALFKVLLYSDKASISHKMGQLVLALSQEKLLNETCCYRKWELKPYQIKRLLILIEQEQWGSIKNLCQAWQNHMEPMVEFTNPAVEEIPEKHNKLFSPPRKFFYQNVRACPHSLNNTIFMS